MEDNQKIVNDIIKGVAEQVTPGITEEVFNKIKSELPNRDKEVFGDSSEAKALKEEKQKAVEYVQKLALGQSTKALSAGGSTSGAELVPTYVSNEVVRVAEKVGMIRRYARRWPMQGNSENIPTLSSVAAYRVAEGAKITTSQPTSGNVQLRSKTVGVIVPISRKLLRNATVQTIDVLNMLAGEAIAKLEDQWGLLGLGSGEGVFQTANVPTLTLGSGDTTYAKVEPEDLLDALDLMDMSALNENTRWVLHLSVLNALRKKRAAVGSDAQGFLFQGFGASTPPTMWDLGYALSPVMPKVADSSQAGKNFMGLVNFDDIIHGDEVTYTMEISEQATITDTDGTTLINLFEQNMVALKVWGEIDIQLANPTKAHVRVKTAAS